MSEVETAIEEINQIMIQYRATSARGRKAWPRSVKDRAVRLSEIGLKAKVIAERSGIPYYTILKWRPHKQKPRGRFRELAVIEEPVPAQTVVTVTVPQTKVALPQKVATMTVTTPDGFCVEVADVTAVVQMIQRLRKAEEVRIRHLGRPPPLTKSTIKSTLCQRRWDVQSANAKAFRASLKEYMDAATSEPVRINRRDGHSFILMSEAIYEGFRNEIASLQRRLLAMNEIVDEKTKPVKRNEDRTAKFKRK